MKFNSNSLFAVLGILVLSACGGKSFEKSPLDEIVRDLPTDEKFSVILHDMHVKGNLFEEFFHQYRIVRERGEDDISEITTDWHQVGRDEFQTYVNDMGMEIAARDSTGKLTKSVAPPGYNNYVGNEKYGRWENRGGSSFWAFYGQYAFMSSMFRMATYPAQRSYYNDWRGNYRGTGRRYYGPSSAGGSYYGTNSAYNRSSNPNSVWSRNRSSFKNRVAGRTSRSSSTTGRTSRSSGSSRSRGGGFGK